MSVLHAFRRHERRLARGVLALFGLVWLQLAAAPCGAMHATPAGAHRHHVPAVDGPVHDGHAVAPHAGHAPHAADDHAHHDAPGLEADSPAAGSEPCPWCPPQHGDDGCADGSRCAFPHAPQVDARLPPLFLPPPEAPAYPAVARLAPRLMQVADERPEPVPRLSFTIDYCRFIE